MRAIIAARDSISIVLIQFSLKNIYAIAAIIKKVTSGFCIQLSYSYNSSTISHLHQSEGAPYAL